MIAVDQVFLYQLLRDISASADPYIFSFLPAEPFDQPSRSFLCKMDVIGRASGLTGDDIAVSASVNPLTGTQFCNDLLICLSAHHDSIYIFYKILINLIAVFVAVIAGQPVDFSIFIGDIAVETHREK